MDKHFSIKTENDCIGEDDQYISNEHEMEFPIKIEKASQFKDEGLDIEFIKEEPKFCIEDESNDRNINNTISEEVLKDDSSKNRGKLSAPWPLSINSSEVKGSRMGVWTQAKLPRGFTFGPYEGRVLNKIRDEANPRMSMDVEDTVLSNWLCFVTGSRTCEETNLAIFQYKGQIYYKTLTEIKRGAELMMWYSDEPRSVLGYQLENHNENSTTSTKETKTSCMKFPSESSLSRMHNFVKMDINDRSAIPLFLNLNRNNTNNFKIFFTNYLLEKLPQGAFNDSQLETLRYPDNQQTGIRKRENYDGCAIKSCNHYTCSVCDSAFNQLTDLEMHLRTHSGKKPNKCFHCDKVFTPLTTLKRQLQIHNGEKPYKCSKCEKAFTKAGNLKTHLRIHSGEKPYKCSQCKKAFIWSNSLKEHLQTHSEEKPYKCSQCNKAFTQSNNLKRHLQIHIRGNQREKPYKCSQCKKEFMLSCTLKLHLRLHSGEKLYKCFQCEKAFTKPSCLKMHLQTHMEEKPYKCSQCNKAFTQLNSLKRHHQLHSGEKPYTCFQCNRAFAQLTNLKRHLQLHNGKMR